MVRSLKDTWLATAMFVGLSLIVSNDARLDGPWVMASPPLTALLLTPPVWRWFVMSGEKPRVGRALLAGGSLGFLIAMTGMIVPGVWFYAHRPPYGDGSGDGLGGFMSILYTGLAFLGGGVVGGGVGALLAWAQSRSLDGRPVERRAMTETEGAFAGGLVAVLAGPIAALFFALILPKEMLPTWSGAFEYSTFLAEVWLVLVPMSAFLGARATRRWRRISAPWTPT